MWAVPFRALKYKFTMETTISVVCAHSRVIPVRVLCSKRSVRDKQDISARISQKFITARFCYVLGNQRGPSLVLTETSGCHGRRGPGSSMKESSWFSSDCMETGSRDSEETQYWKTENHTEDTVREFDEYKLQSSQTDVPESLDASSPTTVTDEWTTETSNSSMVSESSYDGRLEDLGEVAGSLAHNLLRVLDHQAVLLQRCTLNDSGEDTDGVVVTPKAMIESGGIKPMPITGTLDNRDGGSAKYRLKRKLEASEKTAKRDTNRLLRGSLFHARGSCEDNKESTDSNITNPEDARFMKEALKEAKKAAMVGEVPVGAVIVQKGKIIARAYNRVEADVDPTAHAEMLCIRAAAKYLEDWRLMETTMYVTLEPCPMCAGAILQSRVKEVVWGARNTLLGADGSWVSLFPEMVEGGLVGDSLKSVGEPCIRPPQHPFHNSLEVRRGVLAEDCSAIMRAFFQARRKAMAPTMKKKPWWMSLPARMLVKKLLSLWTSVRWPW